MAGGPFIDWPDDDELVARVLAHPTYTAAARANGWSYAALQKRVDERGIRATIRDGRQKQARPLHVVGEPVSELEVVRAELKDAHAALAQHRSGEILAERIVQAIDRAIGRVLPPPARPLAAPAPAVDGAHVRPLLVLSDFHGGEIVDAGAVHGLNTYDWQIMEARIDEVLTSFLAELEYMPPITGLDVGFLGDMNSGFIHKELAETNQYGPIDGAVRIGYVLHSIIERLRPHVPGDLRVFGVPGNHGRIDKAPAAKREHNNLDWISYKLCEALLADEADVTCHFPEAGSLLWPIAGRTIYVWHGDGVRTSMPGVPWGGVSRRCNEIAATHMRVRSPGQPHGIRLDHFLLGHFHAGNVVASGRVLINPALKGLDEYCLKSFGGGDLPGQLLLQFDEANERLARWSNLSPTAGVYGEPLELPEAA